MNLYIHIPFCRRKCFYCDFYSVEYDKDLGSAYSGVLCRQIEKLEGKFSTIFIGGGTPTVLDVFSLEKILKRLSRLSAGMSEFTIEANPESLTKEKADLFISRGCNRISIGGQSFCSEKLNKLGRTHCLADVARAVTIAQKAGFKNINLDLIFGVWGGDLDSWMKELRRAVTYPLTHISVYALTLEKNTPFFKAVKKNQITPLDDDIVAKMYGFAMDYLPRRKFHQYEVSNFSKEGHRCRHNLNYWENNSYVGIGPSAVSLRLGLREKNVADIKSYIKKAKSGESVVSFKEKLSQVKSAKEFAAVKIRTKEGIDFAAFKHRFGFDFLDLEADAVRDLRKQKLLNYRLKKGIKTGVCLTRKGFLFCDEVSSSFL
ncbi:MAG: radical SAM family heme chaperone HemW [Candidatus Omnitrophota bacterium]|nr:MAG: radical SAM family heme chaperone HemW [Candidatus Omnitrophota bacterium]